MSLSKIDKNHASELLLSINQQNFNHNSLEVVRTNYLQYGKLKQIAKEMERLKNEAQEIIQESFLQHELHNITCKCKKISGTMYHLYEDEEKQKYLSIISPTEWNSDFKHTFIASYYYDYDKTFTTVSS